MDRVEFGFIFLGALSFASRLCVKEIENFSQRRKEDPKAQRKPANFWI
jgi:hypothetical protein